MRKVFLALGVVFISAVTGTLAALPVLAQVSSSPAASQRAAAPPVGAEIITTNPSGALVGTTENGLPAQSVAPVTAAVPSTAAAQTTSSVENAAVPSSTIPLTSSQPTQVAPVPTTSPTQIAIPSQTNQTTAVASPAASSVVPANSVQVTMYTITAEGRGGAVGIITFTDTPQGLSIRPDLRHLPPGPHGFHLHANGDCASANVNGQMMAGMAAGDHYDPVGTYKHEGPDGHGHRGDMPVLNVASDGTAKETLITPRLKIYDLHNHAIIIHQAGDNYSDNPSPNGGGGARISCGVVP